MPSFHIDTKTSVYLSQRVPSRFLGYAAAFLSTAILSTAFVISKEALRVINPESFIVYWYTAAFTYALIYGHVRRKPPELTIIRRNWKPLLALGVTNAFGMMLFFVQIQMADPALVSFLGRITTLFTVFLGVIVLGERLRRREWIGAAVILAGALTITYHSDRVVLIVFVMTLFSASLYASSTIIAKRIVSTIPPLTLTLVRAGCTAAIILVFAIITGRLQWPPPNTLGLLTVGALGSPFASHVLLYYALSLIDASKASLIGAAQPAFVLLYSLILFGSLPLPRQILGGLISIGGVAILISARSSR